MPRSGRNAGDRFSKVPARCWPCEPVTKSERGGQVKPTGVSLRVLRNFFEDRRHSNRRLPVPDFLRLGGIQHDPGDVKGAGRAIRDDGMGTEPAVTPVAELLE